MSKWSAYKERLHGIKFWAQWFPMGRKPQYEVFVFTGLDRKSGYYYFAHYKNPSIVICKNWYQLARDHSFRPFCFNTEEIIKFNNSPPPAPFTPVA